MWALRRVRIGLHRRVSPVYYGLRSWRIRTKRSALNNPLQSTPPVSCESLSFSTDLSLSRGFRASRTPTSCYPCHSGATRKQIELCSRAASRRLKSLHQYRLVIDAALQVLKRVGSVTYDRPPKLATYLPQCVRIWISKDDHVLRLKGYDEIHFIASQRHKPPRLFL
jgi:hypothetical protein